MIGRGVATNVAGEGVAGRVGSEGLPLAAWAAVANEDGVAMNVGSLRTEVGTSGRGANSATRRSICWRLRPLTFASTAW
jgi:hypothetical protein